MRIVILAMLLTSCGMRVDTSGDQDINVKDSKQEITVTTTLDKILEVCGIVKKDGTTVPYSKWTDEQEECLDKLNMENTDGRIDKIKEGADEAS